MEELLCPSCKRGDRFTTKETMIAYIECEAIYEDGPEPKEGGDSYYESAFVSGVDCGCGWGCHDSDWMKHLHKA